MVCDKPTGMHRADIPLLTSPSIFQARGGDVQYHIKIAIHFRLRRRLTCICLLVCLPNYLYLCSLIIPTHPFTSSLTLPTPHPFPFPPCFFPILSLIAALNHFLSFNDWLRIPSLSDLIEEQLNYRCKEVYKHLDWVYDLYHVFCLKKKILPRIWKGGGGRAKPNLEYLKYIHCSLSREIFCFKKSNEYLKLG